jgi:hypothetical protein
VRLVCTIPANQAKVSESVDNLIDALSDVAAVEIKQRPDATNSRLVAVLTTRSAITT